MNDKDKLFTSPPEINSDTTKLFGGTKICLWCLKDFPKFDKTGNTNGEFCSDQCKISFIQSEEQIQRDAQKAKTLKETTVMIDPDLLVKPVDAIDTNKFILLDAIDVIDSITIPKTSKMLKDIGSFPQARKQLLQYLEVLSKPIPTLPGHFKSEVDFIQNQNNQIRATLTKMLERLESQIGQELLVAFLEEYERTHGDSDGQN